MAIQFKVKIICDKCGAWSEESATISLSDGTYYGEKRLQLVVSADTPARWTQDRYDDEGFRCEPCSKVKS